MAGNATAVPTEEAATAQGEAGGADAAGAPRVVPEAAEGSAVGSATADAGSSTSEAAPELMGSADPDAALRSASAKSQWRWPSEPGKLPNYVQRNFRIKTFGLLAIQFALVFGLMSLVEPVPHLLQLSKFLIRFMFVVLGVVAVLTLSVLYFYRNSYPMNYLLLLLVTVLVGLYWGLAFTMFTERLHFQVIGISGIAVCVATMASGCLTRCRRLSGFSVVAGSLGLGWLAGSLGNLYVTLQVGTPLLWAVAASVISLGLLGWLLVDVGKELVRCNPDDFMRVIVAMDSTLLVVVSIPFFLISACILHCGGLPEGEQEQRAPPPV